MTESEKKQRILVVDDIAQNISIVNEILKPYYKIMAALSGPKALEIANSDNSPDLILLDIMMPEMDGFEVCKKLKSDSKTREIPIIFLSALDDMKDKVKGLELGAVDYLSKPFQPEEVLARVKTHLKTGSLK
jgi:putative two-component system response regulator